MEASASSYDDGLEVQAKQLATRIRLFVHDTKNSESLLSQLGLKDCLLFFDTSAALVPGNLISHTGLTAQKIEINSAEGNEIKHVPLIDADDSEFTEDRLVSFEEWWNKKIVIRDLNGRCFTRHDLVLEMADTDGGAHVDGALEEGYVALTRGNSTGWNAIDPEGERPLLGVELASIRQIAEEMLRSLEIRKFDPSKVGRNDSCPCGSGKKFKKCCGN